MKFHWLFSARMMKAQMGSVQEIPIERAEFLHEFLVRALPINIIANNRMSEVLKAKKYPHQFIFSEASGHVDQRVRVPSGV